MKSIDTLRNYMHGTITECPTCKPIVLYMLDEIEREHAKCMHEAICKAHADGERNALKQVRSSTEDYRRGYKQALLDTKLSE